MDTLTLTIDEALDAIARRSFYEDAIITPQGDGTFLVEDDWNTIPDDMFYWYNNELCSDYPLTEYDHSGLMDPSEFLDNHRQIERYLPTATAALKRGKTVCFSYFVVRDLDDGDEVAGWMLVARILKD